MPTSNRPGPSSSTTASPSRNYLSGGSTNNSYRTDERGEYEGGHFEDRRDQSAKSRPTETGSEQKRSRRARLNGEKHDEQK